LCADIYHNDRAESWPRFASQQGLTFDEIVQRADGHSAELVRGGHVCTRITGETLLKVLDDGEFKSYFETERSYNSTITDASMYIPYQRGLFGFGADLASNARPIYGYLTRDPLGRDLNYDGPFRGGGARGFGSIAAVFSPEVTRRTTVTFGDSFACAYHNDSGNRGDLFANRLAAPLDNPNSTLFPNHENPLHLQGPEDWQGPQSINPYIETQTHRWIMTPRGMEIDPLRIESLARFTFFEERSAYPADVFDALDSRGIRYSFEQDSPSRL
jgi:hypothetical protein